MSAQQTASVDLDTLIQLNQAAKALALTKPAHATHNQAGNHVSRIRGRGIDFNEVRVYQMGDDIRHMDWRVTARRGKPHTKLYHEERERPVFLFIDLNSSMFFGTRCTFKSVIAAKAAALLGWTTIKHGDKLGAIVVTDEQHYEFRPHSRERGILPLLKKLAELTQHMPQHNQPTTAFKDALNRLRHVAKPGSLIFILSDFVGFDADCQRHLHYLARHNQIINYFIADPLEKTPPPANHYAISDGHDTITMNTYSKRFNDDYQAIFATRLQHITDFCKTHHIGLFELTTATAILPILQHSLAS